MIRQLVVRGLETVLSRCRVKAAFYSLCAMVVVVVVVVVVVSE